MTIKFYISGLLNISACFLYGQTFSDESSRLSPISGNVEWGVSAIDYNNDGLVDIFHRKTLYLNRGDAYFTNEYESSGIQDGVFNIGGLFGDYDNDGYLDVLVLDFSEPSLLYKNTRLRTFFNVNQQTGVIVNDLPEGGGWSDYNRDGKLDLFVGNDLGHNQLFQNLDRLSFADVSESANLLMEADTYGAAWGDYNNDGYPDLFLATCSATSYSRSAKKLLRNEANGTFSEIAAMAGVSDSLPSWGIIWLDYDNDNDLDIYIANIYEPPREGYNRLYRNEGSDTFTDVSQLAGVKGDIDENSYGLSAADFDNDGWIDIYVANSNKLHRLFHNNGDGTFDDVAIIAGITDTLAFISAAADYNNDGWMDIFTTGEPSDKLLLNNGGNNHWLMLQARGVISNYHGIGTRIEVFTKDGFQIREINAGDSFNSQNDMHNVHFGLGQNVVIDSIICRWPSGKIDVIKNIPADQRITVVEDVGINQTPDTFNLVSPQDDVFLVADTITFTWRRSQNPESEDHTYRLYLRSEDADSVITILNDTSAIVSLTSWAPGSEISWSVDVSDGYSVTASKDVYNLQTIMSGIINEGMNPEKFVLFQNYPNPFNPLTRIEYFLPEPASVLMKIYDLSGREVKTLVKKNRQHGFNFTTWDGRNDAGKVVASGIYFYSFEVSHKALLYRRLLFLK